MTKEIGKGEAEVISLAIEDKVDWVILDDQDARRFAHRYGLNVIGTLGLLAWANRKQIITDLKAEINKLEDAGFYIKIELKQEFLKEFT